MALTYLLDASVLTRLASTAVRTAVERLAVTDRLARSTITDLELGFSARNGPEHDSIAGSLATFAVIDVEPHHLRRAFHVQRTLADRGLRGRKVPDLIVAACAEDLGQIVLHYDADFDHIAGITGQRVTWVVPSGSID